MDRFLVPETSLAIPSGFTRLRQDLTRGVPFQWALEGDLALVLLVPTGFAAIWRDADPAVVVSSSADETAPHTAPRGADPHERPAVRLLLRRGRTTLATLPLATALTRVTPDGDEAKTAIELRVTSWLLHAGCVRGPGDFGSFIEVAWRRADKAVNGFAPAPIHPIVATRQSAGMQNASAGHAPGALAPPPNARVIVTRQDANGRNTHFRDTFSGHDMTRAEFVTLIRAGEYPGYAIRTMHGVETPVSRPNTSTEDNLG